MTISTTVECNEIIHSSTNRRRWTPLEKQQIVHETYHSGATVSYVARKHGIPPSQLFYWRKLMENSALTGVKAEEAVVPQSEANELKKRIKQLEQVLGQKTLENEILREAVKLGRGKKTDLAATLAGNKRFRIRAIARALEISRSNLTQRLKKMEPHSTHYCKTEDNELLPYIREIIDKRSSYGYRRVTILLNHRLQSEGKLKVNHKRVYRIMKLNNLLLLAAKKKPTRSHDGKVITMRSNTRWCSDCFTLQCANGDRVHVAFAMDTCDREVISYISSTIGIDGRAIRDLIFESMEYRFGKVDVLPKPIQWLSDNGPCYVARETVEFARNLGFDVRTTPAYSPESNGMAEAFVKTFKRDYVAFSDPLDAHTLMKQLPAWFEDYNENAPHKGLKMMAPRQFIKKVLRG
ncbi:IS3 family transposase [Legionella maioricensis]|uniref:IS3 family transposase n=1 Tax=Legionella maioricensis TaxID=2896528 RepID=A0A9X2D373_9GAMM|nr:IS3 family transposase [Legionella maioricensis]MCL9685885.1 IS3 family transposase [Legionella maioricensis]MCL9689312.1 IS3 family transposase [Legionella maioricensis]